jgi:lysophospholipase L1-like esterase
MRESEIRNENCNAATGLPSGIIGIGHRTQPQRFTSTLSVEIMTTILCFGDSNTWGFIPGSDAERYPREVRYTGILQHALGRDFRIIEEGLNGRTTVWEDPLRKDRKGKSQLPFLLESHAPLDLVTIMLGTNDLKHFFGLSVDDIAMCAGVLVEIVQQSQAGPGGIAPKVILMAPAAVKDSSGSFGHKFDGAIEKSHEFPRAYQEIANSYGCNFFNAGEYADGPIPDGVHLDAESHQRLGEALAATIKGILS